MENKIDFEIQDLVEGQGVPVSKGCLCFCYFVGRLVDGTIFDRSEAPGKPFEFVAGSKKIIPGFSQGLMGMKEGGKRKFKVPHQLAYQERGVPGKIPPLADLFYEVEMIEVRPRE